MAAPLPRSATSAAKCVAAKSELFDHVVGEGAQLEWNVDAQCAGGLQVQDELELGRQLHRQFGRLGAPEDAIDVGRGSPVEGAVVRSVAQQAPGLGHEAGV